ncbi:hypothetical protein [Methylobacterium nodulans]|uniref:Uncharacterized protein n=1 Tax=Methylobacterium nodulans (strain LMG 21967 / CNCM I-2342 / ORS 2060) TaxID=460265 RepID=B8IKI6_METNO|nr:hypothetical protein [Methylobacterium nodulans]ACL56193.1 conserved hypothetical protein [Methylobacterium nodulans ORS 2060]
MAEPRTDLPPTHTIKPIDPPPAPGADSTSAQLKADIDSGRTGDKTEVFDPGLAPLGTDDEAAGHPPSPEQVAQARRSEGDARWTATGAEKASYAHHRQNKALPYFLAFIVLVALIFASVLWFK